MTFDPSVSPKLQQSILTLESDPDFLNNSPSFLGHKPTTSHPSLGSECFCTLTTYPISACSGELWWTTNQHYLLEWETSQPGLFFVVPVLESSEGILILAPFFLEDHESFLPTTHPASYGSTLIDLLSSQIYEKRSDWFQVPKSAQTSLSRHGLFGLSQTLKTSRPGNKLPSKNLTPLIVSQLTSKPLAGLLPASDLGPEKPPSVYHSGTGHSARRSGATSMAGAIGQTQHPSQRPYLGYDPF